MLQTFNKYIKGWAAVVVTLIVSASFILWGVQRYLSNMHSASRVVATVNGLKITDSMVMHLYRLMQNQLLHQTGKPLTPQQNKALKRRVLHILIDNHVVLSMVSQAGFFVGKNQLSQVIVNQRVFQQDGHFSANLFQRYLYASGMTQKGFLSDIANRVKFAQLQNGIQNSAFVLPHELKTYIDLTKQSRDFRYLVIPTSVVDQRLDASGQQLKNYYRQHLAAYRVPEQVSISYLQVSPDVVAKQVKVTAAMVKNYYDNNLSNFLTTANWKIERVFFAIPKNATVAEKQKLATTVNRYRKSIVSDKDFAKLFQSQAGITQNYNSFNIPTKLQSVLSHLQQGDISQPFQTKNGWNIVRLLHYRPIKQQSLRQVQQKIKAGLVKQKTSQLLSHYQDQLANLTYTDPETLQPAAKVLGLSVKTSTFFSRKGGENGITANAKVVSAAFSSDVLKDGNNSPVISLEGGGELVLRVHRHLAAHTPNFVAVRDKVKKSWLQMQAHQRVRQIAEHITQLIVKHQPIDTILKRYRIQWIQEKNVNRAAASAFPKLVPTVFSLNNAKVANSLRVLTLSSGELALVQLLHISTADKLHIDAKERGKLTANLSLQQGNLDYAFLLQGEHHRAHIVIKPRKSS